MKKTILILFLITSSLFAQSDKSSEAAKRPRIFVSGSFSDMQYLKEQIPIVDYVNDRKDADVHVLAASQSTGSGGTLYTLFFYGQNQFNRLNDTIKVVTDQIDSGDIVRKKVVNGIKNGLFNYIRKSEVDDLMILSFSNNKSLIPQKNEDPWDSWVFRASFNGYFNGETSSTYAHFTGSFSANRTTEDLRLNFSVSNSYMENIYDYTMENNGYDYHFKDVTRSQSIGTSAVKSISDHWSIGTWGNIYKSTYGNIDFEWSLTSGIEFNVFPYSESSQKMLRIVYKMGINYNKYFEETIYNKESEYLATNSLSVGLDYQQPWGSVSTGIIASNYWQDFSKYDILYSASLSLKLFKGISLNGFLSWSKVNNQLALAKEGASVEEVLLKLRQIETSYYYYASVGISFSFGSIFNNIVNPRFGEGGA